MSKKTLNPLETLQKSGGGGGVKTPTNKNVYFKSLISFLGFSSHPNDEALWEKYYPKFSYKISINFSREKIIYPQPIILGDETTSNFSSSENFVVLECVDRLLTIGYPPFSITLENKWSLGRINKGKLDILIKDKDKKSYLMIECKTWGAEYQKEKNKMLKDGGQLISYYQQDRNAQYLCLYSSQFNNNKIIYENDIIKIEEDFKTLADVAEVYTRWNKQFSKNGIFNEPPYQIQLKAITKKDLKELKKEDSSLIYNQFLEILRHNVVSDKANAFNKIFNLFLCKVLDEDKNDEEQLSFQWIEEKDTYKSLLNKLNNLYKDGMKKYLEKDITDYNEEDLKDYQKDETLRKILEELRLYKNQEFAFLEVFNKKSFEENAKIVKEVVQLLQNWQIRYTHKQQFLGEFFELLLNTGFKQESGQFFTPVPLVRFILKSLPIAEIIEEKIKNKEDNFLPYLIDFACGSGHFLTEAMDIIQEHINNFKGDKLSNTQSKKLKHYQESDFEWAKEFVYGIEKDYRLVKTTKLACFLHGDGEAKIIHASGIAPFGKDEYKGKLEKPEQFDLLIANPPYSVSGFRSTVKDGDKSFNLFKNISDNSSDIEVLFIERMLQLLKPNGLAGIVLPASILSNGGNYEKARELILSNFEIKAITCIGQGGFMATGTSTVTLFLKKLATPLELTCKKDYKKMSLGKKLLIINSGEKDEEKKFLGYEFSNRRGSEGLKKVGSGLLYNENNRFDNEFANSYILNFMLNNHDIKIHDKLKNHINIMELKDCFNWDREDFSNTIQLKKKLQISSSKYDLVNLGSIVNIKKGKVITKDTAKLKGDIPVIAGGKTSPYNHNISNHVGNVITIGASGEAGYVWYHDYPIWASDCFTIVSKNEKSLLTKYVYYILKNIQDLVYSLQTGSLQKHVYEKDISSLQIPNAPIHIQEKIIKHIETLTKDISNCQSDIEKEKLLIKQTLYNVKGLKTTLGAIGDVKMCRRIYAKETSTNEEIPFYKIGTFGKNPDTFISKELFDKYKSIYPYPKKGDVLISASGTIGRIVVFDGSPSYFQDSNIVWIDNNEAKVLNSYLQRFYSIIRWNSKKGVSIERLYSHNLKDTEIIAPSLLEQKEIVKILQDKENKIFELEKIINKAKAQQRQIVIDTLGINY